MSYGIKCIYKCKTCKWLEEVHLLYKIEEIRATAHKTTIFLYKT